MSFPNMAAVGFAPRKPVKGTVERWEESSRQRNSGRSQGNRGRMGGVKWTGTVGGVKGTGTVEGVKGTEEQREESSGQRNGGRSQLNGGPVGRSVGPEMKCIWILFASSL